MSAQRPRLSILPVTLSLNHGLNLQPYNGQRTVHYGLSLAWAAAGENEPSRSHAGKVLRHLKAYASVCAEYNDCLSREIACNRRLLLCSLVPDEIPKSETHDGCARRTSVMRRRDASYSFTMARNLDPINISSSHIVLSLSPSVVELMIAARIILCLL
jgi:hypothetical protein